MVMRVAIVDDKHPNRNSLQEKFREIDGIEVVFTAPNGQEFLTEMAKLPEHILPEVVLMDIEMPIMDGIIAVKKGSEIYPAVKFIMLTVFDDEDNLFDAIKAGAVGYLLKDEKIENIVHAIKDVLIEGGAPMSPRIARKALLLLSGNKIPSKKETPENLLSDRETEILKSLVEGNDYRVVAEKLFISPHTVRKHISNIYEKLHVTSRVEVVKLAIKKGWFS